MYILYECEKDVLKSFYPFSLSHPLWELRAGIFTIKELWEKLLEEKVGVYTERSYIRNYLQALERYEIKKPEVGDILLCSHYFPTHSLVEKVKNLKEGVALLDSEKNIVAYGISYGAKSYFEYYEKEEVNVNPINWLYEVIDFIKIRINEEFELVDSDNEPFLVDKENIKLLHIENIKFGRNVQIDPFVVIDAGEGKVFIDDNVKVGSFSYLKGPLYVGRGSLIKPHSRIYDGVSIGEVTKVAGEVEESIILGYSNKQHDGFLGHAFVGEWVNLGALTTNSDLKNNYGIVKLKLKDEEIDTGRRFLGVLIGDHSKSGIMTMFNTGTLVGFSSNVFGAGYHDKFIPSFSWGQKEVYHLEKAIRTAKVVMGRRNVEFKDAHKMLFEYIFELRLKEGL